MPSFLMLLVLSAFYVRFGGLPWMQSAFYGIGAAVIAIIARSALKLVKLTLARSRILWVLFSASALATAWTESEIIWLFPGSGLLALFVRFPPKGKSSSAGSTAATGAIAGAAFVLGRRALTDVGAILIALTTCFLFSRFKKLPEPLVIVASGVVGLVVHRS
jgi:chromate transporter